VKAIRRDLAYARRTSRRTKQAARRFKILEDWETLESWSRPRRVIAKAEWTQGDANPRFLVTSLNWIDDARYLYEDLYCARGDMENRIKECQTDMFAGRTSAASMRANQLRLWFAAFAYVRCAASG
jgi:Transposase DDE domain group 1